MPKAGIEPTIPRAFDILTKCPVGCAPYRVPDGRMDPHLREGEWAVIDYTDRDLRFGDVYLIQHTSGDKNQRLWLLERHRRGKVESDDGEPAAVLAPLCRPVMVNGQIDWSKPVWMWDGPIKLRYLREQTLGRCIGVLAGNGEWQYSFSDADLHGIAA